MNTDSHLISTAEHLFDQHGFTATGMDRVAQAACMSSRTLYKYAGSKTALIAAVLSERDDRFMRLLNVPTVDALFESLEHWIQEEGARGCLFLRAQGESGGEVPEISKAMRKHKARLRKKIHRILCLERGEDDCLELAEQLLILIEGATAAAVYRGPQAVKTARGMAALLLIQHSDRSRKT